MEKNQMEESFQATMVQVPAHMTGWTWSNLDRDGIQMKDQGYLLGPNEARIYVRLDLWKKRIVFNSWYPNHHSVYGKSVNITVAPTKTPEKIAKDLAGRFLNLYLPEFEAHRERVKKADEYEAHRTAMMQKVADYFGVEIHERGNVYPQSGNSIYVIEPCGADTVKFTVECSAEQAIKVFEVLK